MDTNATTTIFIGAGGGVGTTTNALALAIHQTNTNFEGSGSNVWAPDEGRNNELQNLIYPNRTPTTEPLNPMDGEERLDEFRDLVIDVGTHRNLTDPTVMACFLAGAKIVVCVKNTRSSLQHIDEIEGRLCWHDYDLRIDTVVCMMTNAGVLTQRDVTHFLPTRLNRIYSTLRFTSERQAVAAASDAGLMNVRLPDLLSHTGPLNALTKIHTQAKEQPND